MVNGYPYPSTLQNRATEMETNECDLPRSGFLNLQRNDLLGKKNPCGDLLEIH